MKVRLHGLLMQPHALGMDTSIPAASAEGQVLPQLLPWALPSSERPFSTLLPSVSPLAKIGTIESQSRSHRVTPEILKGPRATVLPGVERGGRPIRGCQGTSFAFFLSVSIFIDKIQHPFRIKTTTTTLRKMGIGHRENLLQHERK